MSNVLLLLIGAIIGILISYISDAPMRRKEFACGYDRAVNDMLHWNCYFDRKQHQHFVNVFPVDIDEMPARAGDRKGQAWNDASHDPPMQI